MGHHQAHCNADHRAPVGCPGCSCEAGHEIKRLRALLKPFSAKPSPYYDGLPDDTPAVIEVGPECRRVETVATLGDFRAAAAYGQYEEGTKK